MAESKWSIERLSRRHDRSRFDCGNSMLDDWLRLRASQYEKKNLARTYVAVNPGETLVLGYYALSNHGVVYQALPEDLAKGLPRIDVPVVLIGRLAVDVSAKGQGLGSSLLIDAFRRVMHIAEFIGIRAVEVDATDEDAIRFYSKFGFVRLLDDPKHLFLSVHVIRKLNLPSMPAGGS